MTRAKIANGAVGLAQMDSTVIVNPASPTTWTAAQTFQAGVTASSLTVSEGHLVVKQTTIPTTVVSNTSNITTGGVYNATDMAGKALITATSSAGAGDYLQINFNKPFATPPIVVISAVDGNTASNITKFYAVATTTYIRIALIAPTSGSFQFNYIVMGTQ